MDMRTRIDRSIIFDVTVPLSSSDFKFCTKVASSNLDRNDFSEELDSHFEEL